MNAKWILIIAILTASVAYSKDIAGIPVETRIPIKTLQVNDGVSFLMPWFIFYNKYDDCVYVVDQKEHLIRVFDNDLNYLDTIGRYGQGEKEFNYPAGIAFDPKGGIYICDVQNHRVQILDKNRNFVSSFRCRFNDYQPEICLDSKGRIYLNLPSNDALISVFDKEGNLLNKIGELYHSINKIEREHFNHIRMVLDEEDNIYCSFQEFPVLRKYNRNFKLVYEKEYAQLPEVIQKTEEWRLNISKRNSSKTHFFKLLNMNLSLDNNSLFLGFLVTGSNPIYVIDKKNGKISKRILLVATGNENGDFYRFDASNRDFLFSTDIKNKELYKFKKWRK